jgi:hypothetical protein
MDGLAIWLIAIFFFGMGVLALADPIRFAATFGLDAEPHFGTNEVRAVYGGFGVFISGLILYAAARVELREGVFTTVAVALLGMAAGRVVSAVIERGAHPLMYTIMFTEAVLAGILLSVR